MVLSKSKNNNGAEQNGRRPLHAWEKRLSEAFDELWNDFVDPSRTVLRQRRPAMVGPGVGRRAWKRQAGLPGNERELSDIRDQCRALAVNNEFAVNGHENRINYIVGAGHAYKIVPKPQRTNSNDKGAAHVDKKPRCRRARRLGRIPGSQPLAQTPTRNRPAARPRWRGPSCGSSSRPTV